jgi:hypothetical protein
MSIKVRTELLADARAFFKHWERIESLRRELGVEDDVLLDPIHFLTATDDTRRSCSVACWDGEELVGLVYATQHYARGVKTGYAAGGDYSGRGLLLCRPEREAEVVEAAIRTMLKNGLHGLHLRLMPKEMTEAVIPGARMKYLDALIPGDRMMLLPNFDEFLGTLGKHTRRNVRYYTRKTLAAGMEFVPFLTTEEYEAGVERLNSITNFPADPLRLARDRRLMSLHNGGQRLGLRGPEGELVAVVAGFSKGTRFHVLTQLNDVRFANLSLSTVLRGMMVEQLIGAGHTELQFMGGSSLSFGRFCVPQRYRSIFVDKKWGAAAAVKQGASHMVRLLASQKKAIPSGLMMIANGWLEEWRLIERTALGPAAVAFAEGHGGASGSTGAAAEPAG